MLTLKTIIGFLCFRRESVKQVATNPASLWIGLLFVIAAGFAREYDGEYLLAEPWHLALPLAASLIGCSAMVLVIFIAAWCRGEREAGFVTTYGAFLRCYWMTAPMALLYGIPVERMFDPLGATQANLWLLGIVATWRVLLMIRCVHVLYGNRLIHAVVVVMLFSDILAMIALAYVPGPIIMIMGGVRLTPSENMILSTRIWVQILGYVSLPFWVIAYGVICGRTKQADPWRLFRTNVENTSPRVQSTLLWVAIGCIVFWFPFLIWTQPEQRLRWQAESMIGKGNYKGLATLSRESDASEFPPHWDPPPRTGYGELDPKAHRVLYGLLAFDSGNWLTEAFARKTEEQLGRRGWMIYEEMSNDDLRNLLFSAKKLENGKDITWALLRSFNEEDDMPIERKEILEEIKTFNSREKMNDEQNIYISGDVAKVRQLHSDLLTPEARRKPVCDWLDAQAARILQGHADGNPVIVPHITCWHPSLVGKKKDEILDAEFLLEDARETIAREYGFADWEEASAVTATPDAEFEKAVDLLLEGKQEELQELLKAHPDLVHRRSVFGHKATLLHYVGSNGVETWRQVVPLNLDELTRVILDAGADVNALANIYGESTTLSLLTSSAHPAEAGLAEKVAHTLKASGAE